MSWDDDAPEILELWKSRIAASTALAGVFDDDLTLHYPDVQLVGDSADEFPCAALFEEVFEAIKSAPGESEDAPGNAVSAIFYFDPEQHSVAQVESVMTDFCRELVEWTDEGLSIVRARKTRATAPAMSQDAGSNDEHGRKHRQIAVVAWYS